MVKKIAALLFGLIYLALGSGLAFANSRPYFRTYGADTASGGWFNSGASSCSPSASTFQAPTYSGLSNLFKGGVMAYAKSNGTGAGSQFGVLSLGLIEGNNGAGEPYGFTSGSSGYNKLSFANFSSLSATNYWGGFLEGSDAHQASHCLPDYFGTKQNSPQAYNGNVSTYSGLSGQYIFNNAGVTTMNSVPVSIVAGQKVTFFVNGDAYIGGNITYGAGYTADNVPKFALVVQGSIYIAPGVSRLDGLYIAQPKADGTSGVVWTCHDGTTAVPLDSYVRGNCGGKLTFNGAVIARQVALLRIAGDSAGAGANESAGSGNIAEVFNFTPEMVVSGCFFNCAGGNNKVESLISLPPVF